MNIDRLIDAYSGFEQRVRQEMERRCRPFCTVCRQVCCRIHFCVETRESVFLARVVSRHSPHVAFDPVHGWLGPDGCRLVAGRPPVCYEFVCRDIPDALHGNPHRRHAMVTLGMLVSHLGKRVLGGRHLVELTDETALMQITQSRFSANLVQAEAAFLAAVALLNGEWLDDASVLLSRIAGSPRASQRKTEPATQRAQSGRRKM